MEREPSNWRLLVVVSGMRGEVERAEMSNCVDSDRDDDTKLRELEEKMMTLLQIVTRLSREAPVLGT